MAAKLPFSCGGGARARGDNKRTCCDSSSAYFVIIVNMAQAAIHLVDVNVIKRLRVLLLDRLHADVDEMTHHLHDMGIITREQRDTILTASNAPMQRCRSVLDLLVYRNGFFDSFVYCLEIMGKINLARLLRLYRTATQQGLPTTCLLSKFVEDGEKTTAQQQQQQPAPQPVLNTMLSCLLERMACMERALQELNMTLVCSSNSSRSSAGGSEPRSEEHATATSDVTA
jgi:hypothetical protein